jgi:uncharacterized protein YndB with AHSA1/START domain
MTDAIAISFEVGCSAERAFDLWTNKIGTWWPADHTVTGGQDVAVVIEGAVGGRIYERTADGVERDWGLVTAWDPPRTLAYSWHLGRDSSDATAVTVCFVDVGEGRARIEIDHRGWEKLGVTANLWRDRNRAGWETLLPHLVAAIGKGDH